MIVLVEIEEEENNSLFDLDEDVVVDVYSIVGVDTLETYGFRGTWDTSGFKHL